jgi:hypothetical protein
MESAAQYPRGAGLALAAVAVPGLPTASAARVPEPVLKLEAAQPSITLDGFRGQVFLDPGIWLAALGSPLQFDVQRTAYTRPVTITQVIHPPYGGTIRKPLPGSVLDGWHGLKDFVVPVRGGGQGRAHRTGKSRTSSRWPASRSTSPTCRTAPTTCR